MKKIILGTETENSAIEECLSLLKIQGSVLLLPTETVYGLMCSWNDELAIRRIEKMKRRDANKNFQLLSDDIEKIERVGGILNDAALKICWKLCPGPLTLVIKSTHGGTIGFRIPKYYFLLKLIAKFGHPLTATSANISGEPPYAKAAEALVSLDKEFPDILIDGGLIPSGALASTVVDLSGDEIKIIRKGLISEDEIRKAVE